MKLPIYQYFGSPSSQDIDVVFFVETIRSIKDAAELCKHFGRQLTQQLDTHKAVNANLAVLGDQQLTHVYKGTTDELNNALFHTYSFHTQQHEQQIQQVLPRDIGLKLLRSARVILSFLSRTAIRSAVKAGLKGDLLQKLAILEKLRLADYMELGKHGDITEFYKTAAFQLGQSLGLRDGIELYTKEAIAKTFPQLHPYLFRHENAAVDELQKCLHQFVDFTYQYQPNMRSLKEYQYQSES